MFQPSHSPWDSTLWPASSSPGPAQYRHHAHTVHVVIAAPTPPSSLRLDNREPAHPAWAP